MNLVLGDVEETVTTVDIDEETFEEIVKVRAAGRAQREGPGPECIVMGVRWRRLPWWGLVVMTMAAMRTQVQLELRPWSAVPSLETPRPASAWSRICLCVATASFSSRLRCEHEGVEWVAAAFPHAPHCRRWLNAGGCGAAAVCCTSKALQLAGHPGVRAWRAAIRYHAARAGMHALDT